MKINMDQFTMHFVELILGSIAVQRMQEIRCVTNFSFSEVFDLFIDYLLVRRDDNISKCLDEIYEHYASH